MLTILTLVLILGARTIIRAVLRLDHCKKVAVRPTGVALRAH